MTDQEVPPRFPPDERQYVLLAATGRETAATLHQAKHRDPATGNETPVLIKIVDVYKTEDIYSLTREVHLAETCDHENVVKVHFSFMVKNKLWIVMPLPEASLRQTIRSSFRHGLPVNDVVFVLKEVLKGLDYLHGKDEVHENVDAGCIFMHGKSTAVKLAFPSLTECSNDDRYPGWTVAPELMMDKKKGNSKATDVWMFGLLALELFHGQIPASDIQEFKALVTEIENQKEEKPGNRSRFLERIRSSFTSEKKKKKKNIPGPLREVLAACFSRSPEKRPTANQLLNYKLFEDEDSSPGEHN